ncbi:unnamed protein product [Caenorhabditis nigoni]
MNNELNEKLIKFINRIAVNVFLFQFVISTIGLIMNIPHLFILLHKYMRTSSTNSVMIGIAICDLIVLSELVYERVQGYWFFGSQNPCINEYNYWYMCSLLIGEFLRTIFERASFWLGVFLSFTRLIIMKMSGSSSKISNPLFGYFLVLVLIGLSSVQSLYFYSNFSITELNVWEPEHTCTGYPEHYSETTFERSFSETENLSKINRRYKLINGILVSVSYPILTVFLFFELRKSAKFASKALSKRSAEERHRTSRMILVKSIFYVIASTPAGISEYVVLFVTIEPQSILETLVGYGSIFISALFCLNASSHGIISLTMSTKYRETVKKCLGWEKQRQGSIISVTKNIFISSSK